MKKFVILRQNYHIMNLLEIVSAFAIDCQVDRIEPLGNGLINDSFKVFVVGSNVPKYVLQRINNSIFTDVDMLQDNIDKVTSHIHNKMLDKGEKDIERKVLRFLRTKDGKLYHFADGKYWRMMLFIRCLFRILILMRLLHLSIHIMLEKLSVSFSRCCLTWKSLWGRYCLIFII